MSKGSISIRKRIKYRNSFQTELRASLTPLGDGTELMGTFGLQPFVKNFFFLWFGFLFIIGGTIFIVSLYSLFVKEAPIDIGIIMGILIPPGMAIFGVALLFFGRYLASDESAFMKAFLIDLLDAKEIKGVEQTAEADVK